MNKITFQISDFLFSWDERRINQQQVIRLIGARNATMKEKEIYYASFK